MKSFSGDRTHDAQLCGLSDEHSHQEFFSCVYKCNWVEQDNIFINRGQTESCLLFTQRKHFFDQYRRSISPIYFYTTEVIFDIPKILLIAHLDANAHQPITKHLSWKLSWSRLWMNDRLVINKRQKILQLYAFTLQ